MKATTASMIAMTAAVTAIIATSYKVNTHTETVTINVVEKERIAKTSSDSDGKVSTRIENNVYSETETYEVSDNLWLWHFTSGTVYASIKEGQTCDVTLSGYRVGILSWRQNIIKAECKK